MEKLSLYERLLKNKNRLKVQAVSLVLAATAVITTGCGKTNTDTPDVPKPGVEDVIDNDNKVEETMTQLTVENLDSEAEKFTNELANNGLDVSIEEIKAVLLHLNKDSFTDDEYYSLFDVSEYQEEPINAFFKKVSIFNTNCAYDNTPEKIVNFKDFCRNDEGYKVLGKLDECSLSIAKAICSDSNNIDSEVNSNLSLFYEFLDNNAKIKIGDETFLFDELDDATKTLIMYSCTSIYNYVKNVCSPERLSDETKKLGNDVHMFAKVFCLDSYNNIYTNMYNNEFSKQK